MRGVSLSGVREKIGEIPEILNTYMICCPALDLDLRFLPNAGGYYEQYYSDMFWFRVIEGKIIEIKNREYETEKRKANKH